MPIIHLGDSRDIGKTGFQWHLHTQGFKAHIPGVPYDEQPDLYGPHVYATYLSHVGYCLYDYERNGYDDSDWYMVVWNPDTHSTETICFASTRGWSYPCYGSSADATPEVRAEYEACKQAEEWIASKRRWAARTAELCHLRHGIVEAAQAYGFPSYRLSSLRHVISEVGVRTLVRLLTNSRIRSAFKLKLRAQVITWLQDPTPKYRTPLSRKQMECIQDASA